MVSYLYRTVKEPAMRELDEFRRGAWVYVENPTTDELDALSEMFALERGHLTDATDPFEVPRVEVEGKTTYIFLRLPYRDEKETSTLPIMIAIGEAFVVTVVQEESAILNRFRDEKVPFFTTQKVNFFLQLFFEVTQNYNRFLTTINKRVRTVSVNVEERVSNDDIMQFVRFESTLNDFLAALIPMNALLRNFLSGKYFPLYEQDEDLIDDLMLANEQLVEMAKATLKNIVNIREAYSTIMTNNLNRVIKIFTALTIVLTIPTMIASFFGMNVPVPLADNPLAFGVIIGFSGLISIGLIFLFLKKQWL